MKSLKVIFPIVEEIAMKLGQRELDEFHHDPELFTVALLLEANRNLKVGATMYGGLELAMAKDNVEEANRLLNREVEI